MVAWDLVVGIGGPVLILAGGLYRWAHTRREEREEREHRRAEIRDELTDIRGQFIEDLRASLELGKKIHKAVTEGDGPVRRVEFPLETWRAQEAKYTDICRDRREVQLVTRAWSAVEDLQQVWKDYEAAGGSSLGFNWEGDPGAWEDRFGNRFRRATMNLLDRVSAAVQRLDREDPSASGAS